MLIFIWVEPDGSRQHNQASSCCGQLVWQLLDINRLTIKLPAEKGVQLGPLVVIVDTVH